MVKMVKAVKAMKAAQSVKIFSFVMLPLQRQKAGSLDSRAWISTGSLTGQPYFPKIDRIEKVMQEIDAKSSIPLDRLRLLLRAVSKLFEDYFGNPINSYEGEAIHCLSIKLGIESHLHRNLITLYGSKFDAETRRESMVKVIEIITKGMFYRSLNAMLHAFAYTSPKDALSVFALVLKLGAPDASSISPLLVTFKHHDLKRGEMKVEQTGENMFKLMNHYRIPLVPRVLGGIVEIYVAKGYTAHALEIIIKNINLVDNICITAFLDGCFRHEDMDSASRLVEDLERRNFRYIINVSLARRLKLRGLGVEFGRNVITTRKECGISRV